MAKKKPKAKSEINYEKFGWKPGDLKHSRDFGEGWFTVLDEERRQGLMKWVGYNADGTLPEWDSLTDEQKIRFAPFKSTYGLPLD